jgi:hypothetical protein
MPSTILGEHGTVFPTGTTAQRPTAAEGMIRYNTTTSTLEIYAGGVWKSITLTAGVASSGGPTTFNSSGTFTTGGSTTAVSILVVGGGGAGGYDRGGGGGAGGLLYGANVPVSASTAYTVTVGGGASANSSYTSAQPAGGNSQFGNFIAYGGGGSLNGGWTSGTDNRNGGSGAGSPGGGQGPGTATQTTQGAATGYGNGGGTTFLISMRWWRWRRCIRSKLRQAVARLVMAV